MIQNHEQWGCCSEHFWWCAGAENWVRGIRFRGEMEGEELGTPHTDTSRVFGHGYKVTNTRCLKRKRWPGTMVHTCILSYSG